jgi:hypothetical protein
MAELFGSRHIEQLVIPEIQRDYVWKPEQVRQLLNSILKNFNAWQSEKGHPSYRIVSVTHPQESQAAPEEIESAFVSLFAKRYHATNIGFVYAYNDGDLPGQYYLIDGQQRLTTIFLTLLAAASLSPNLKDRFRSRYCLLSTKPDAGEKSVKTRLDYRLRELTAEFLHHCIPYLLESPSTADQLKLQSWYRQRLDGDKTVENLIANFRVIYELVVSDVASADVPSFFGYLEELVDCWYFDTNESAQGEELYLYLNARGENIAPNENLKARLLAQVGDAKNKDFWGKSWEEWQDFFWQRRRNGLADGIINPNADRGFNCFLSCVENLEHLRAHDGNPRTEITPEVIDKYFRSLRWLEREKEIFKLPYAYAGWVDSWFKEMWSIFNDPKITDWAVDPSNKAKGFERNRMVLMWGTLLSVVCFLEHAEGLMKNIDSEQVFRTIRIFWLRYNNNNRAAVSLSKAVSGILLDSPPAFIGSESQEELAKWRILNGRPDEERRLFESAIWEIEDHPLNINGRDLGNLNISHLLELDEATVTLDNIEDVKTTFYELFPPSTSNKYDERVAQALLYYGAFWDQESPWYYENYNLGDWRRTIRGKGGAETKGTTANRTVFQRFFQDFMQARIPLDEFLKQRMGKESIEPNTETDLRKALIWYSEKLGKEFLKIGWYVAVEGSDADANFISLHSICNTVGHLRGYNGNQKMATQIGAVSS